MSLGKKKNCAEKKNAPPWTVRLPENASGKKVLRWVWVEEQKDSSIRFYENCADVIIHRESGKVDKKGHQGGKKRPAKSGGVSAVAGRKKKQGPAAGKRKALSVEKKVKEQINMSVDVVNEEEDEEEEEERKAAPPKKMAASTKRNARPADSTKRMSKLAVEGNPDIQRRSIKKVKTSTVSTTVIKNTKDNRDSVPFPDGIDFVTEPTEEFPSDFGPSVDDR